VFTLIESPVFSARWPDYLSEDERGRFAAWLAHNPEAGDVVPGSGGVRKVRWSRDGQGKRGGVRVIYYNQLDASLIWLLTIDAKSRQDNAPAHILRSLKEELVNGS
jgi:mRNA-degrading endonuclease RelE of RelBE toxin-antitoxin system